MINAGVQGARPQVREHREGVQDGGWGRPWDENGARGRFGRARRCQDILQHQADDGGAAVSVVLGESDTIGGLPGGRGHLDFFGASGAAGHAPHTSIERCASCTQSDGHDRSADAAWGSPEHLAIARPSELEGCLGREQVWGEVCGGILCLKEKEICLIIGLVFVFIKGFLSAEYGRCANQACVCACWHLLFSRLCR